MQVDLRDSIWSVRISGAGNAAVLSLERGAAVDVGRRSAMAARGIGAIVPATGATGMAPIAAVGGKANSPIGKVCCVVWLASSEWAVICQAALISTLQRDQVFASLNLPTARWQPRITHPDAIADGDTTDISTLSALRAWRR